MTTPFVRVLSGLALLVTSAEATLACSVCAAGDPLVAVGDSCPTGPELRAAVETEWLRASAGMEDAPGVTEELDQWTLRVVGVYSPIQRVNLALSVPLVRKEVRARGAGMAERDETFSGLGDVDLGARWFLVDRTDFGRMRHQSLALSAGSSLPTGENDASDAGVRVDEHSQIGTGAWGPYLGVLYRIEQGSWHAFATVATRLWTENRHGYRRGETVAWTVQAQRELGPRFALGFGIDGRQAAADREDGADVPHTGGFVLTASPELHVNLGGPAWFSLRAQIPFATRLNGEQDVGPTVTGGLRVRFL